MDHMIMKLDDAWQDFSLDNIVGRGGLLVGSWTILLTYEVLSWSILSFLVLTYLGESLP